MHPAYSVIFFTVSSGAGYGLLIWTSLTLVAGDTFPVTSNGSVLLVALIIGAALVIAGLLSSTFHLGHPERAWRALSQWRSSWLSREGVFAVLGFIPLVALVVLLFYQRDHTAVPLAALLVTLIALLTVYCTAMIYASLKPIPRWNNGYVPAVYLLLSLASGAVLLCLLQSFYDTVSSLCLAGTFATLSLAWAVKLLYWRSIKKQSARFSAESATGLGAFGKVSVLESPHTSANYLQKEMGFRVARKHAHSLRRIALHAGWTLPVIFLTIALFSDGFWHTLALLVAALTSIAGLLVERWLFFAEAQHAVTTFYGSSTV